MWKAAAIIEMSPGQIWPESGLNGNREFSIKPLLEPSICDRYPVRDNIEPNDHPFGIVDGQAIKPTIHPHADSGHSICDKFPANPTPNKDKNRDRDSSAMLLHMDRMVFLHPFDQSSI